MKYKNCYLIRLRTSIFLLVFFCTQAFATDAIQRITKPGNQSSPRYDIRQTFDGGAFDKDTHTWTYNTEFADLFGMPPQHVDKVEGIAAAAFRIETTADQTCGFGGNPNACRPNNACLLDLYFDESKTPLPWATSIQSQWRASNASMQWLRATTRAEKPFGMLALDPPIGVERNPSRSSSIIPFADSKTKLEAIFATNAHTLEVEKLYQHSSMFLEGYIKNWYRIFSIVSLRFGCSHVAQREINVQLIAFKDSNHGTPEQVAQFNKITLPAGFIERVNERLRTRSDANAEYFRTLLRMQSGSRESAPQLSNPPSTH